MAVHIPVRMVLGALNAARKAALWLYGRAVRAFVLPLYRRSHARWVRRTRLGSEWRSLGNHLEYSIWVGQLTDPEPRHSRIAVRALPGVQVECASFVFEAASESQRFQEPITLHDVDRTPITWTMRNIPHDEPIVFPNGNIGFRWDSSRFTNIEIRVAGAAAVREPNSFRSTYTHTWFLNSEWINLDGVFHNLDAVKLCKENIAVYWRFGFCTPKVFSAGRVDRVTTQDVVTLMTRPVARLMSSRLAVAIQFWVAALTIYRFSDDGELVLRLSSRAEAGDRESGVA